MQKLDYIGNQEIMEKLDIYIMNEEIKMYY